MTHNLFWSCFTNNTLCDIDEIYKKKNWIVGQLNLSLAVLQFVALLVSHGALCDGGQGRSRHAGRLHNLNVLTGQTSHQFLSGRTGGKNKLVGQSSQDCT